MIQKTGIQRVILELLQDKEWHTAEAIAEKCREEGIDIGKGKTAVYTAVFRLRKQGLVAPEGDGKYKLLEKSVENTAETNDGTEASLDEKTQKIQEKGTNEEVMDSINVLEKKLGELKKFNWISCSEEELTEARTMAERMITLSKEIQSTFDNEEM